MPLASGLILRAVFDALSGRSPAGLNVWTLVALMAAAEAARLVVIVSTVRFGQAFHLGLAALMRGAMLSWLVSGPGSRAAVGAPGEVVSRFRDDVGAMDDFMEAWIDLSGEMLLCLGALTIMFSINAAITTAVVLPLIAIVTLTDRLTARIQRLRAASREASAQVAGFIAEAFGAVQTLQVATAEQHVVAHLDGLNQARGQAALSDRLLAAILDGLGANIAGVGMGLVLLLAAGAMRRGAFTVGDFALFASYVGLAGGGPRWIGRILARRRQAEVSIARMQALMQGAEPLALTARVAPKPALARGEPLQSLAVRGLSYRFPGGERGICRDRSRSEQRRLHGRHGPGGRRQDHPAALPARPPAGRHRRNPLERGPDRRPRLFHGPAQMRLHAPGAAAVQRERARQHRHGLRSFGCGDRLGGRTRRPR